MKTIKALLLISVLFVLVSCEYECPGFDRKYLAWMPYNVGDELIFYNQNSDTIKFNVLRKEVSDEIKVPRSCGSKCCDAYASITAKSTYDNYQRDYLRFRIVFDYMGNSMHYEIYLGKYNKSTGKCSIDNFENHIDTMTINNVFYEEVVVLERDIVKFPEDEIWKLIVANNYGIIKFYDKKTGDEWTAVLD